MTDRTQAMTVTHTPTPWSSSNQYLYASDRTLPIASGQQDWATNPGGPNYLEAIANAAFIVEAVNSFASLKDRIAELEKNEKAYEEIIGKKTFQEVADRIRELEGDLRRSREKLINMAADCHRSKWQFDLNEDYRPTAGAARDLILKAFRELHRIGDVAIKAYSGLHPKDPAP